MAAFAQPISVLFMASVVKIAKKLHRPINFRYSREVNKTKTADDSTLLRINKEKPHSPSVLRRIKND
ncbi:hypothetical protein M0802_000158 [Mischocyttarus mexicanus]|nr:hypothetical protein M0802_000158 [Mischocyttarus mexicanus]